MPRNLINIAGSLRMQSWRMASLYQRLAQDNSFEHQESLRQAMLRFEHDLNASPILAVLPDDGNAPLQRVYQLVKRHWQDQIKPGLQAQSHTQPAVKLLDAIPEFVDQIDTLVKQIEQAVEERIFFLRLILGATIT